MISSFNLHRELNDLIIEQISLSCKHGKIIDVFRCRDLEIARTIYF
ncbi:hypothetical protein CP10139811_0410 [Chlamydia ibidis]|uniref:Uncharacterized protein n=2 Tax=Chlamydia ibidis TaxID=1405396 RepID=S7J247_9CHLA|nr:hypothetical protein CP10139811_0410 [Chlamydia ibidis]EQM62428.1 hypothetical protein H359_0786 [Chlamydia ibidis 10-1398/6]